MHSSHVITTLRHTEFRKLWVSQALSAVGNGISPVALAVLVLGGGRPGTHLGLVLGAQSAGLIGFILVGGVLADRVRRTRLMAFSDIVRAVSAFSFALVPDHINLVVLVVLATSMGAGAAMFEPAHRALLPSLVPERDLEAANALNGVTARSAFIVGAPLAGLLVAVSSPHIAFAIDGLTFVISMIILLWIKIEPTPRLAGKSIAERGNSLLLQALEGIRIVRGRPWAAAVIAQGAIQVLLVHAPVIVLVPLVLRAQGALNAYGIVLAAQSVGSVLGALLAARWKPREPGTVALLGMLAGIPALFALFFGLSLPLLTVTLLVSASGGTLFAVLWTSALQRSIPNEVLARVVSLDYVGQLGLEPAGLALTAPAVAFVGLPTVIMTCAIALLVTTIVPFLVPGVRTFGGPAPAEKAF